MPRHLFFAREPSQLFAETDAEGGGIEAAFDVKVPQWVHILPKPDKDGLIYSRDNRVLHVGDLEALAKRSNAALKKQKGGGPVDADHRIYGWPGGGKALGWAEEFEARPSGLFARTEWLDEGKQLIGQQLYRYTSSVVFGEMEPEIDEESWQVTWHITPDIVEGFAITNIPALATQALFAQAIPLGLAADEREQAVQVLLRKMGLSAEPTGAEIRDAWSALAKRLTATSVGFSSASAPSPESSAEPTPEPATSPSPAPTTAPAEGDDGEPDDDKEDDAGEEEDDENQGDKKPASVEEQLAVAKARIEKLEADAGAAYVDDLVRSGKLTPAQKPAALAQAQTAKGLAQLRALYEHAPAVINPSGQPAPARRSSTTSAPPGVNPTAFDLAGQKLPAHEIARRLREQEAAKEHSA
jgi:phage I-like protein